MDRESVAVDTAVTNDPPSIAAGANEASPVLVDAEFCQKTTMPPPSEAKTAIPTSECKKEGEEKQSPNERLKRSRERNRVHARKTRQRKKEQMLTLQTRADELKQDQVRLKQGINEKNTASILVGLFATAGEKDVSHQAEDPRVERLLKRSAEEIPDATKITELPALILPGQHNSKKAKAFDALSKQDLPDDGIDYQLLGKDRSKCTPEELDKIRRERNRMHAKRTRDRKRLFMEEMSDMCKQLEDENNLLRNHLRSLDGECPEVTASSEDIYQKLQSQETANGDGSGNEHAHVVMDQLKTLIEVAGSFESKSNPMKGILSLSSVASSVATAVSASDSSASVSVADDQNEVTRPSKQRRLPDLADEAMSAVSIGVPHSITAVGV